MNSLLIPGPLVRFIADDERGAQAVVRSAYRRDSYENSGPVLPMDFFIEAVEEIVKRSFGNRSASSGEQEVGLLVGGRSRDHVGIVGGSSPSVLLRLVIFEPVEADGTGELGDSEPRGELGLPRPLRETPDGTTDNALPFLVNLVGPAEEPPFLGSQFYGPSENVSGSVYA